MAKSKRTKGQYLVAKVKEQKDNMAKSKRTKGQYLVAKSKI